MLKSSNVGGNGEASRFPRPPKRQVALTAKQWSAVVMAVTHGAAVVRDSKTIPLGIVSEFLEDIGAATAEISEQLADRDGPSSDA